MSKRNERGTVRGVRGLWFANQTRVQLSDVLACTITRVEGENAWVRMTDERLCELDRGMRLVVDRELVELASVAVTVRHVSGFVDFDAAAGMMEDRGAELEAFGGDS